MSTNANIITQPTYIVHYDWSIRFSGPRPACEAVLVCQKRITPELDWRISTIAEYGKFCYNLGYNEGEEAGIFEGGGI
jgi:hypothetical protein